MNPVNPDGNAADSPARHRPAWYVSYLMNSGEDERDPDRLHDAMRDDDMPPRIWPRGLSPATPARAGRTEEQADHDVRALRRRAMRLSDVLRALVPDEPPPTIPDHDEPALEALTLTLEHKIARAADVRGHAYARRGAGLPMSCPGCARPIERAAERCLTARR
jgi:hypothetical protein